MYLSADVTECDLTGKKYPQKVRGAWILSQGASGRVCPVLFVGPEYIKEHGLQTITRQQAEEQVATMGRGAWLDLE